MTCELCKEPCLDLLVFETGNNAEYTVEVPLCESHIKEYDDTGYDFETKYAEQILECLYERWRGAADHQRSLK